MKKIILMFISCFLFGMDDFFEPGFSVGGYGELHYNNQAVDDGDDATEDADPTTLLDFHRYITFINYNFTEKWSFKSELELEHNFVSDGEGELELEQAYVNYHDGNWGFGAGVVLISAGIINETHEPPTFLSVERPDYNKYIIPTTWFGNGMHLYGKFGDFNMKFVLHEDLDGENMFSINDNGTEDDGDALNGDESEDDFLEWSGIRDGRAKGYKSTAYSWTKNMSFAYTGIEGIKLGGSYTTNNAPIDNVKENTVDVSLMEFNVGYNANNVVAAFEYGMLGLAHSPEEGVPVLGDINGNGYYLDLGYNVAPLMGWNECKLMPWFRTGMYTKDDSDEDNATNIMKLGLTYKPIDQISFKLDYGTDTKGETTTKKINLGVGYMF